MAAVASPFGVLARFHPSGQARSNQYENVFVSGQTGNIFYGTPVMLAIGAGTATPQVAGSNVQTVTVTVPTGQVVLVAVNATTSPVLGIFAGCEYTDVTGVRKYSKFWPSATTLFTGTYAIAYVWDDPENIYEIQADAALNSGSNAYQVYGRQGNFNTADLGAGTAPAGNASPVGQSAQRLNATLVTANGAVQGTSNTGQLTIVQSPDINNPLNTITDLFPSVYVKINKNQLKNPQGSPASV